MSGLKDIESKLHNLQNEFENCESGNNYEKTCEELITLASELIEELDTYYDNFNEIEEYIGENINNQNLIDYESLVKELKKDNLYNDKVETLTWLDKYTKFYSKCLLKITIWKLKKLKERINDYE